MFRYGLVLAASVAACGVADDRPRNLAYITEAILAPTCGAAQCHGQFRRAVGDEYDTVDAARTTMWNNAQLRILVEGSTSAADTYFIKTITIGSPSVTDQTVIIRMPFDAPMPNEDVALIEQWIEEGADGAQCLPGGVDVRGPDGDVHPCDTNGNRGPTKSVCVSPQICNNGISPSELPGVCCLPSPKPGDPGLPCVNDVDCCSVACVAPDPTMPTVKECK